VLVICPQGKYGANISVFALMYPYLPPYSTSGIYCSLDVKHQSINQSIMFVKSTQDVDIWMEIPIQHDVYIWANYSVSSYLKFIPICWNVSVQQVSYGPLIMSIMLIMSCYTGFFNVRRGWQFLNTGPRFYLRLIRRTVLRVKCQTCLKGDLHVTNHCLLRAVSCSPIIY
jgi:hypothetical protein